jgi:hypothetical protein
VNDEQRDAEAIVKRLEECDMLANVQDRIMQASTVLSTCARWTAILVLGGWILGVQPARASQPIRPSADGTLADGGVYGSFDGVPDSLDWTFNQSSFEGSITRSMRAGTRLETRMVCEYNLAGVTLVPPVSAVLNFTLRSAPVYPAADVVVQVYSYPADLKENAADFAAGPASLVGTVRTQAGSDKAPFSINVSASVNAALAGSKAVAFRFQIDPASEAAASQVFIDALDSDLASKPSLVIDPGGAPMVTAWDSVRAHGAAGSLAINLDASSSSGTVECRSGGVQQIQVTFSAPVQVSGPVAAVNLQTGTAHMAVASVAGSVVTLSFAGGLPDQSCFRIDLAGSVTGLAGQALVGDTDCAVRVLAGDINGDGMVASGDITQVKSRSGQSAAVGNVRFDVNSDGQVASGDISQVKSKSGKFVGCQ